MLNKKVSVIITTKNEENVLERLLVSIKKQNYKNFEIIIVDNKSTDKTKIIAKKFSKKVYDFGPERSAQRNFGAQKAKGDYLLFLDADMELSSKIISSCVKAIESKENIAGVIIPEKSIANNYWSKVKAFERSFYNLNGDPITDAARFFRRKVFKKIGGYDETITGPEDWDLPETIRENGYKIKRINQKIFHYERIPSLKSLFKKKYYYSLSAYRYLEKHKIPIIGPKTIYFLRPVFMKNWQKLVKNPALSFGLLIMLIVEIMGGGLGYLIGRIKRV